VALVTMRFRSSPTRDDRDEPYMPTPEALAARRFWESVEKSVRGEPGRPATEPEIPSSWRTKTVETEPEIPEPEEKPKRRRRKLSPQAAAREAFAEKRATRI
jgi:hypothetical protein